MYGSWLFVFLRLMTGLFWYVSWNVGFLFTAKAFQVRYTNLLRCKPDFYMPFVYVWTQMEGRTQHFAGIGGHLN
jgi:hypothetical protein